MGYVDFRLHSQHGCPYSPRLSEIKPGATALPFTALAPVGTSSMEEVAEDAAVCLAAAEHDEMAIPSIP